MVQYALSLSHTHTHTHTHYINYTHGGGGGRVEELVRKVPQTEVFSWLCVCVVCVSLSGSFNPCSDDPLPACPKKQLILKIISGQQLPKPPDSMLGDRGEVHTHTHTKMFEL